MTKPGRFIVIEAPDGVGKTTLVDELKKLCEAKNNTKVLFLKEPYVDLPTGKHVREWIDTTDFMVSNLKSLQALYLFSASRIEMIETIVLPALQEGKTIICDRFALSTAVYQNLNNADMITKIMSPILNNLSDILKVDTTLFLYADYDTIIERIKNRVETDLLDEKIKSMLDELNTQYSLMLNGVRFPKELLGEVIRHDTTNITAATLAETVYKQLKL